jgi:hypothetical protein
MKKLILSLSCILALGAVALGGSYDLVRLPEPGAHVVQAGGTGKVVQIEVYGSAVSEGTVTLHKLVPGGTTSNLQYTATCSGGAAVAALATTNTFYVSSGDTLYRGGTATNGLVRLIVQ